MIREGERLWNGAVVTRGLADAYNAQLERIESFRATGREAPEYILNGAYALLANTTPERKDS